LRIVPYNGNRAYKYYLDGYKVNGKRKRLFFKEAAANRKLTELAKQQRKERQDGLDIPLDLRVMAVKAAKRLAPFNKSVLDAAEFLTVHEGFGPLLPCWRSSTWQFHRLRVLLWFSFPKK
jgi:hypothetical protein